MPLYFSFKYKYYDIIYIEKYGGFVMEELYLELPSKEREQDAMDYIIEFYANGSVINGTGSLDRYINLYDEWLEELDKDLNNPGEGRVPASTYFAIRKSDNKIVGMVNIRHKLNDYLIKYGAGHIGYSVRPTERRKGYATKMLFLALNRCKEIGVDEVYIGCCEYNVGSYKTIKKNGGKLVKNIIDENNVPYRCYIINNK